MGARASDVDIVTTLLLVMARASRAATPSLSISNMIAASADPRAEPYTMHTLLSETDLGCPGLHARYSASKNFFGEDAEAQRTQSGKNSGRFARAGRHTVRRAALFLPSRRPLRLCVLPKKKLAYLVMD
jgi:hypothetical protein